MTAPVLLDSGPLIALLDRRDRHHAWAVEQAKVFPPLTHTCEAVLTEVVFVLARSGLSARPALEMVRSGLIKIPFRLEQEVDAIDRLMARYASVPMSLAHACLVRMTELHERAVVMTLDSDFRIYRRGGNRVIPTITP